MRFSLQNPFCEENGCQGSGLRRSAYAELKVESMEPGHGWISTGPARHRRPENQRFARCRDAQRAC